jgi:hypothetical protein
MKYMSYLKTIVRFTTKNPGAAPGSRYAFIPLRDERQLARTFMTQTPGSEVTNARPGAPSRPVQSMFREGTDMIRVSSADFTYFEGQGGASEYFLNNIDLDETTPVQLYAMVNQVVTALRRTTTLLDGKRITKMYAADRANGITADAFYQHMTGAAGAAGPQYLRPLVSTFVGAPGVITRPLVIVVELEIDPEGGVEVELELAPGSADGGSKRKSRRKSTRKLRRR